MLPSLLCLAIGGLALADVRVLDARKLHLGNDATDRFADVSRTPQGERLEVEFEAVRNPQENVLIIHQRDVSGEWLIELNGKEVGRLAREAKAYELRLPIPPDSLANGRNKLVIRPQKVSDDIIVGDVRLDPRPLRELLQLEPIVVRISERGKGPIPARIDFVRKDGARPPLYDVAADLAVRAGVLYTGTGEARAAIEPGEYDVFATRGMEWGLARGTLRLDGSGSSELALEIEREVDTTGYIAADTHIHTLEFSGHGDSSVKERVVTLAAQGVELAIATDHNHHTDYRPRQRELKLDSHFTPVTGNEVTTDVGHFTGFPFDPTSETPDHKIKDFVKLVADIRDKGAKVVFLNHPRWPKIETGVFANLALDQDSGEMNGTQTFTFDGIEIINTNTPLDDSRWVLLDWFALLNAGFRLWGVASSDTHTVGQPVGMGRTYVKSATDEPSRIDVDACCREYRAGHFAIAFGIFTDATVNGVGSGETTVANGELKISASVRHPSWVTPTAVTVYQNGLPVASEPVQGFKGPFGHTVEFTLPAPRHDGYIVVVAEGNDVAGAWWPSGEKYTLGITNPIFVDADGDGVARSPKEVGRIAFSKTGEWKRAIVDLDDAAAIQVLALVLVDANEITRRELLEFQKDGAAGRARLAAFLARRLL